MAKMTNRLHQLLPEGMEEAGMRKIPGLIILAAAGLLGWWAYRLFWMPVTLPAALKSVELRIPKGASAADAIDVLTQHHLIADPALALWSLRLLMV